MSPSPPLFTRPFVLLLVAQAVFGLGFSTFLILPAYLATELAASPSQIGLVTSIFGITGPFFLGPFFFGPFFLIGGVGMTLAGGPKTLNSATFGRAAFPSRPGWGVRGQIGVSPEWHCFKRWQSYLTLNRHTSTDTLKRPPEVKREATHWFRFPT